jgi:hypothetical protein
MDTPKKQYNVTTFLAPLYYVFTFQGTLVGTNSTLKIFTAYLKTIQISIQCSISTLKIYGFIMQTIMMDFFTHFFPYSY